MVLEHDADDIGPVLVQFSEARGMQPVAPMSGAELAAKSAEAIDKAMSTMRQVADRVLDTIRDINVSDRPAQVEVEFGLTLDAEAGALIAKVGTQAGFKVKLVWKAKPDKNHPASGETSLEVD